MKPFLIMTWTEFKLFLREPAAVFFTLAFPLMMLFIFGSIYGNDPSTMFGGRGSVDVSVPGYVGMIIGTTAFMAVPIVISEYRHQGIFRRLRATPVNPLAIILSQTAIYYLLTAIGLALLVIAGKLVYDLRMPASSLNVFSTVTLGFLTMASIGFVVGAWFKTPRTANVVGNIFYFPQMFLSGATFPREIFSQRLRDWTEWLPLTQVVTIIKAAWFGDTIKPASIIYLVVLCVVSVVVSMKVFKWE